MISTKMLLPFVQDTRAWYFPPFWELGSLGKLIKRHPHNLCDDRSLVNNVSSLGIPFLDP